MESSVVTDICPKCLDWLVVVPGSCRWCAELGGGEPFSALLRRVAETVGDDRAFLLPQDWTDEQMAFACWVINRSPFPFTGLSGEVTS